MKISGFGLVAALVLISSLGSSYAENQGEAEPPVGSTPRILTEIEKAQDKAEKRLEAAFKKLVNAIQQKEKDGEIRPGRAKMIIAELNASQGAWQEFRQKQCGFLYSYYYEEIGSLGARAEGIWEYERRLIEQRIKELENPPNNLKRCIRTPEQGWRVWKGSGAGSLDTPRLD